MRYERKYRIQNLDADSIKHELDMHSCGFSSHYPDRQINSLYFDDPDFSMARSTLAGVSDRSKYRIRWYGENIGDIKESILEKKIKSNQLGFKEFKPFPAFDLRNNFKAICESSHLSDLAMVPFVYVTYRRTYLISFDQKVRATIDQHIEYRSLDNYKLGRTAIKDQAIVLEFKYEQKDAERAKEIMAGVPFRLSKNSKYVNAVQVFWG